MEIIKLRPLSVCETNSYIVAADSGSCVLIDAPADADYIYGEIVKRHLELKKILLTHGHFDHVGAVADLVEKTGCEVFIHKDDASKLTDAEGLLLNFFRVHGFRCYDGAVSVSDGDVIKLEELEFDVVHTPGHTSGSVCYIIDDIMFSGDTLFRRSVGRTDMPDGDSQKMNESMKIINDLGGNLRILPGHMEETSLDDERKYNYFLIQAGV